MARVAYTGLLGLYETPGAATSPSSTEVPLLITELYKEAYSIMYPGADKYTAGDTSDDENLIDNNYTYTVIRKEAEEITREWYLAGKEVPHPPFEISNKRTKELQNIAARIRGKVANIQLWGGPIYDTFI